ncbi:nucleotidyltransferase family protein [Bacillus spongiae]|uniref:Nucleotidyltransferase family protein n=1 Tax=Bacillus spongiae TaxID=2683610 RepID=A0ABU8HJI3_9BACI
MKIIGVYLAAGNSKRTGPGIHKLYFPIQQIPLGNLGLRSALASNLHDVIVVTNDVHWILPSLREDRIIIHSCEQSTYGPAHSLHSGILEAERLEADGVLVMLADQPFITSELLNQIMEQFQLDKSVDFVATSFKGIPQPPVLFSNRLFSKLKCLSGNRGAHSILKDPQYKRKILSYDQPELLRDIDTWEDYLFFNK